MATPPTSNCDDVSQDSSGTFSFAQTIHSSTKLSNSKIPVNNKIQDISSPKCQESSSFSFSNNIKARQGCSNEYNQPTRQSSTEDEEPLIPIDPSDLKNLFGGDNLQYHDGLTDSEGTA